jgi:peptide/nickel transport system permease protein
VALTTTDSTAAGHHRPWLSGRLFRQPVRTDLVGAFSIFIMVAMVIIVLFGPQLAPYDPNAQELFARLAPPIWVHGGGLSHVLGTDQLGRDVLSRLLVGARLTLLIGFAAALLEVALGTTLGLIAGYRGGVIERIIMRLTDIQTGFPPILIILLVIVSLGSSIRNLIFALGVNGWMVFARLVRVEVATIKNEQYVQAARVTGMSDLPLLFRHIIPHLRGRLTVLYLMEVPRAILAAAGLSFLGIGVNPSEITWGGLISDGQNIISVAPWLSVIAGVAIIVTVADLYVFASWLEPRIDPLRRRANRRSTRPLLEVVANQQGGSV